MGLGNVAKNCFFPSAGSCEALSNCLNDQAGYPNGSFYHHSMSHEWNCVIFKGGVWWVGNCFEIVLSLLDCI